MFIFYTYPQCHWTSKTQISLIKMIFNKSIVIFHMQKSYHDARNNRTNGQGSLKAKLLKPMADIVFRKCAARQRNYEVRDGLVGISEH